MITSPNDCAFPVESNSQAEGGLTKREYFATMALQGLCADASRHGASVKYAETATLMADALIEELNRTRK